jgi:hypothetical protein
MACAISMRRPYGERSRLSRNKVPPEPYRHRLGSSMSSAFDEHLEIGGKLKFVEAQLAAVVQRLTLALRNGEKVF